MGKKKNTEYQVTHIFANGDVMTHEELLAKGRVITYENNKEVLDEIERTFNPSFREEEARHRRCFQAEQRKAQLLEELKLLG